MKTVAYINSAAKALRKMPADARKKITNGINRYAESGAGDVTPMIGQPGYRMRKGAYRVIFTETADKIVVVKVGLRRDIYR